MTARVSEATGRRGRRRSWAGALLLGLLALLVLELILLSLIMRRVGIGWTLLLVLLGSVAGLWLLRREGARALRAVRDSARTGRPPAAALVDVVLVAVGGALLLLPGLLSDVLGLLLILPITRPVARRAAVRALTRRLERVVPGVVRSGGSSARGAGHRRPGAAPGGGRASGTGGPGRGVVIEGEVVDPPRPGAPPPSPPSGG